MINTVYMLNTVNMFFVCISIWFIIVLQVNVLIQYRMSIKKSNEYKKMSSWPQETSANILIMGQYVVQQAMSGNKKVIGSNPCIS